MITREQYQFLRNLEEFQYFSIEQFDQLMARIHYRKVPKGQILFFEDDRRDKLFLIYSGYVKVEQHDSSGTFLYIDYVKKDRVIPYGGLFQDERYHFSGYAITDVEYFTLPTELYEKFCLTNIHQMRMLYRRLSRLLHVHEIRLRNMVTSSAMERVTQALAILLYDICDRTSEGKIPLPFAITTIDLANMSGTTRETVSHVLRQLKKEGVIEMEKHHLTFCDKDYFLQYIKW
ncbi:Crp/Fnr family transcriptional regulator [Streptococcus pneumoniae]